MRSPAETYKSGEADPPTAPSEPQPPTGAADESTGGNQAAVVESFEGSTPRGFVLALEITSGLDVLRVPVEDLTLFPEL